MRMRYWTCPKRCLVVRKQAQEREFSFVMNYQPRELMGLGAMVMGGIDGTI